MGLFGYTMAGCGFVLIGAWESYASWSSMVSIRISSQSIPSSPTGETQYPSEGNASVEYRSNLSRKFLSSPTLLTHAFAACFSIFFMVNSLVSAASADKVKDHIGSPFQFQVFAVASLFLLYSVIGIIPNVYSGAKFPQELVHIVVLFGFVEEFLLFYLQRKDTSGVENRYYDLMLVPISICVFSTILDLSNPLNSSCCPRMVRGLGLILQGMWLFQMGISFYSNWIVSGCSMTQKSRGNFTIKCKGHMDYHRGRAIATLQFNCHLALLVSIFFVALSVFANRNRELNGFTSYKPLGQEIGASLESGGKFCLDSDEDDGIMEAHKHKEVEMNENGL